MKNKRHLSFEENVVKANRTRSALAFRVAITLLFMLCAALAFSQPKKFPATITPVLGQPYSLFINDYSTIGSNTVSANIVFNDFNEASWNFRLRIKIESSSVRMKTREGFVPSAPITLPPGVVRTFSGADWAPYFDYNNLDIAGVSLSQLINEGGRLPEGLYSFCFQVLDYDTGDPLSQEVCVSAWLRLMDPPRINVPTCGISLPLAATQHVFSWQLFNAISPNAVEGNQFQLTIWEALDLNANVQTAVANGQALQVFQSPLLSFPYYTYGMADPALEAGKKYIFRVQAIDPGGRDKFRNQGYSEFCHFYYGWPTGGTIQLTFPLEGTGFRKRQTPYIGWKAVTPRVPGQPVAYEVKITPIIPGQTKEQAIIANEPWFTEMIVPTLDNYDRTHEVRDRRLAVMTQYAFQVKGFSDQIEVGKSNVSYFNGPPLMENFWAGTHRVQIDYLDGSNINDLSGAGRIRLTAAGDVWTEVTFSHLKLEFLGDIYVMTDGEFYYDPGTLAFELKPGHEDNGSSYFEVDKYIINKDGLFCQGFIRWALPFPAIANGVPTVKTETVIANYNDFHIYTTAKLTPQNDFALLEPSNFKLHLSPASVVLVYHDTSRFEFTGTVELPMNVKGTAASNVQFPFSRAKQLFYFNEPITDGIPIYPVPSTNLQINAKSFTIDFSEKESPKKFQSQLGWKGIYLDTFNITFGTALDKKAQFDVATKRDFEIIQSSSRETDAFITSSGLNLKCDITPDSLKLKFQTFPSLIDRLKLDIQGSQVISDNCTLKGSFLIPVISTTNPFHFTVPVTNIGFQDGSLDDVIGTRFTHNKGGGDQEMNITVKRAALSSYERIAMTLDIEWPSMGITLPDLRGFNAWGDYTIGFDRKNGTVPLIQRYHAQMSGYAVTMDVIGAGSNDGNYIFATTADAGLGDDVAGSEGAPTINVYSAVANALAPPGGGEIGPSNVPTISLAEATQNATQRYTQAGDQLIQRLQQNDANLLTAAASNRAAVIGGFSQTAYTTEDLFQTDGEIVVSDSLAAPEDPDFNPQQREVAYQIAKGFITVLSKPVMEPIRTKTKALEGEVNTLITQIVNDVDASTRNAVRLIVEPITIELIDLLENDKVDVRTPIREMSNAVVLALGDEIASSLRASANNNIQIPLHILLEDQINGKIQKYFIDNGANIVYACLKGKQSNLEASLKGVVDGAPDMLEEIIKDVGDFVKPNHIRSTIEATASDFIKNISLADVKNRLKADAESILLRALQNEISRRVGEVAADYAQDVGMSLFGGENSEDAISFVGVAQRFAKGGIKGVFNVDRVAVKLRTPVIDLDGYMSYTPKHPVYGDVWLGDIDMTIKVPKKFAFNAIYFNGKKDDISYWFCQITPPDANSAPYELGKPLPKTAKEIKDPINIGIAQIVGASGRLYHHMIETPGSGIVPDKSMRYGAYMHFVFFDKQSKGSNMRLEVSGEINTKENGDYTIAFDGNLQLRSPAPKPLVIDTKAAIQGTVMVRYNSAEEHFFGYAKVVVKTSTLCAQASLLVDVKPGKWRVAIGSREERIIFVPGCAGWSPTGWLDINESTAELGLGLQYSGRAKSPKVDIGIAAFYVELDAGIAAGILAEVRYNPSFKLIRAGIWVDIWANLDAYYKLGLNGNWKSIRLVEIYLRGDLLLIFDPPPTILEGKLDGYVKVCGFGFDFKAEMRKEL